jgi:hypothetical protein
MPRGVKRQPQPPVDEPVVEAVVDEPESPPEPEVVVREVMPEPSFGEDPDDLYGASDSGMPTSVAVAAVLGRTANVVYGGLRVAKGVRADPGPVAVTITVPTVWVEPDYETMVTEGVTYTLHRGQPCIVAEDDAEWLTNHPAYLVAVAN